MQKASINCKHGDVGSSSVLNAVNFTEEQNTAPISTLQDIICCTQKDEDSKHEGGSV
jgi:hypothetical protein